MARRPNAPAKARPCLFSKIISSCPHGGRDGQVGGGGGREAVEGASKGEEGQGPPSVPVLTTSKEVRCRQSVQQMPPVQLEGQVGMSMEAFTNKCQCMSIQLSCLSPDPGEAVRKGGGGREGRVCPCLPCSKVLGVAGGGEEREAGIQSRQGNLPCPSPSP